MAESITHEPVSFPQAWDDPVEGNATFVFDPMHHPFPMSPLTDTSLNPASAAGFTQAAEEYHSLIKEVVVMSCNMYRFWRFDMAHPASEEEARHLCEAAEAALRTECGRLLERWHGEHLPALRRHITRLQRLRAESFTAATVDGLLDELNAIHRDLWTIHFRIVMPLSVGIQVFDEFYEDVFGGVVGDGHALLVGVASESVKAGLGLYDLAVLAKELELEPLLLDTASPDVLAALEETATGHRFGSELRTYLDTYGLRQDLIDFLTPTWQEDPTFALSIVGNYLRSGHDARAEYVANQRSAEEAIAAARADLAAYPEAVRTQFEEVLSAGRAAAFLKEEHNFYIDQQALSLVRLVYLQAGRRLAEMGVLAIADDIFMLRVEELPDLFDDLVPPAPNHVEQTRLLVQSRQDQMHLAHTLAPPPFIGPPPRDLPVASDVMTRARLRLFGGRPGETDSINEVRGNAGSRGIVSGVARVASTLDEATAVRPGEILVAVTTMPAWTPLFGIAAAVVTETGGPLSHCAIVAREYGIPAVVGAHGATRMISTGQRITVDGGLGLVTITVG